jgi:hypothetical protein
VGADGRIVTRQVMRLRRKVSDNSKQFQLWSKRCMGDRPLIVHIGTAVSRNDQ